MANARRGQASFKHDGRDYTIALDLNAFCEAEALLDMNIGKILEAMHSTQQVRFHRALLWAGLQEFHPGLDLREAGAMMTNEDAGAALAKALTGAFPEVKEAAQGATANPRKTGTGTASKPRGQK